MCNRRENMRARLLAFFAPTRALQDKSQMGPALQWYESDENEFYPSPVARRIRDSAGESSLPVLVFPESDPGEALRQVEAGVAFLIPAKDRVQPGVPELVKAHFREQPAVQETALIEVHQRPGLSAHFHMELHQTIARKRR